MLVYTYTLPMIAELTFSTLAIPDANCIQLLLANVGNVLMDASSDVKATLTLQRWWRRVLSRQFVVRRAICNRIIKSMSAFKLQSWYRALLPFAPDRRRRRAAITIQAFARGNAGRRRAQLARLAREAVKAFKRRRFQRLLAQQRDKQYAAVCSCEGPVYVRLVRNCHYFHLCRLCLCNAMCVVSSRVRH
jgi:hypothetical protein